MYICIYSHTHVNIYIYMIYMNAPRHTCIQIAHNCMCLVCVCVCVCVCVYVCAHVCARQEEGGGCLHG